MDKDIVLILVGAGIGLFSSLLTSLIQYYLSIKAEEYKLKKSEAKEKQDNVREDIISGVKDFDPAAMKRQLLREKLLRGEEVVVLPEGKLACFGASTKIDLPDQKYCVIKDIKKGDQVLTFDFKSKMFSVAEVTEVMFGETSEILVINDKIYVTPSHPFITSNGSSLRAGDIRIQEKVFAKDQSLIEIKSIELIREKMPIYNISVSNNRTFFAEGFLVGDFSMKQ